jgi:hypothetical protein
MCIFWAGHGWVIKICKITRTALRIERNGFYKVHPILLLFQFLFIQNCAFSADSSAFIVNSSTSFTDILIFRLARRWRRGVRARDRSIQRTREEWDRSIATWMCVTERSGPGPSSSVRMQGPGDMPLIHPAQPEPWMEHATGDCDASSIGPSEFAHCLINRVTS